MTHRCWDIPFSTPIDKLYKKYSTNQISNKNLFYSIPDADRALIMSLIIFFQISSKKLVNLLSFPIIESY